MTYTSNTWTGKDTEDPQRVASWLNNIEGGLSQVANGGSISVAGDVTLNSDSDSSGAGDIIFKAGTTEYGRIAHDGTITGLAAAANVPTISELMASASYGITTVSTANSVPIFVAQFACNVVAASFVTWNTDYATSDTDYWTLTVRRYRANVSADIAAKNTKTTGGSAITKRTDWNFDAITFDASNKVFQKGDICALALVPTGAPAAIAGFGVTVRYEPS